MTDVQRIAVKEAISIAMEYIRQVYSGEKIKNLGLEEISSSEEDWGITVGFSRSWSQSKVGPSPYSTMATAPFQPRYPVERDYKQVIVDAATGEVLSMEHCDL